MVYVKNEQKKLDEYDTYIVEAILETLYDRDTMYLDMRDDVLEHMYESIDTYLTYDDDIEKFINEYESEYCWDIGDTGKMYRASEYQEAMRDYAYSLFRTVVSQKTDRIFNILEDAIESFGSYLDGLGKEFWGNIKKRDMLDNFHDTVTISRTGTYGWASHDDEVSIDSFYAYRYMSGQVDGLCAIDFRVFPELYLSFAVDPSDNRHLKHAVDI